MFARTQRDDAVGSSSQGSRETPRPTNKRQESREQTRERLLTVGRRAFARKGHAGASLTEDILSPARVSVGSFYHQFRDKTDLFLDILRHHSATLREMVHEAQAPPPPSPLDSPFDPFCLARHTFEVVFRVAEDQSDLFQVMVREQWSDDPRVREYLRENHHQWIASLAADYRRVGLVPPGREAVAELAAELISAMTLQTVLRWLDLGPAERALARDSLLDGLARFSLSGVTALLSANPTERATPSSPPPTVRPSRPERPLPAGRARHPRSRRQPKD